ncbi:MAG: endonuclease III [Anaerolineae bacterium]|nr:endonuclease III [Anaerolineae bacterium]
MADQTILDTIPDFEQRQAKYAPVAAALADLYGVPQWRKDTPPMDELVNCILSQNTNDTNRDRGFDALKHRYPTWQDVVDAPVDEFIDTIRVAGLSNQKGPRIQEVLRIIQAEQGDFDIDFLNEVSIDEAKAWLMSLPGVGPKTAAIVLCFAFGRPAFPVDTHVHRVSGRIGFLPEKVTADKAHPIMEALVPPGDYYAFHINLIQHGRSICHARNPRCERCPLTDYCDYYQGLI